MNTYIKITLRRLFADKTNSIIKLSGLLIGLSVAFIVLIFSLNELRYDSFHKNRDNIYRILNNNGGSNITWYNTPYVLGSLLAESLPEVEAKASMYSINNFEIKKDNQFISKKNILCTESSFFKIFSFKIINGDMNNFNADNSIIISQSIAYEYFGDKDPLGQTLELKLNNTKHLMTVVAVVEDLPINSSIKSDFFCNIDFGITHLTQSMMNATNVKVDADTIKTSWNYGVFFTNFLLLSQNVDIEEFGVKMDKLVGDLCSQGMVSDFYLQPFNKMYFNSATLSGNNNIEKGNKQVLAILMLVGFIILVLANINYINISIAQLFSKSKDVAIRKVCGAQRSVLIWQSIYESVFVSIIALPFAMLIANVFLPVIGKILEKPYTLSLTHNWGWIVIIVMVTIIVGALSGYFVALKTTSSNVVEVMNKTKQVNGNSFNLSKGMLVFQLAIFVFLTIATISVFKQLYFSVNKDLGFSTQNLLTIDVSDKINSPNYQTLKSELLKIPSVNQVSGAIWMPPTNNNMVLNMPKVNEPGKMISTQGLFVDYGFEETIGLHLIKGEFFNKEKGVSGVLVNESAAKALGLTNIIGEKLGFGEVVGLVKDFHLKSIHEIIPPTIIVQNSNMINKVLIRTNGNNMLQTIDNIKETWHKLDVENQPEIVFYNDKIQKLYESDMKFAAIITVFTFLSIFISVLGLIGISLISTKKRIKEIGIRKVNGATISELMNMLNRDFVKWVLIAFVIATPIAYYVMNSWLQNFAYKTTLSWWVFALAGSITLTIALLTVSWQTFRAARKNPVEALRYE